MVCVPMGHYNFLCKCTNTAIQITFRKSHEYLSYLVCDVETFGFILLNQTSLPFECVNSVILNILFEDLNWS